MLSLIASLALASACATPAADERPPNLVLILADDLGYGDLGCYGQREIETPALDALAAEGMRFTDFYAGSTVCAPSRCVLMTGLHTGHAFIRGNRRVDLRPEDVTVAEVLKSRGYATGLFGKWGLGTAGGVGQPTRRGFDEFFGFLDQRHAHNSWPAFQWRGEERVELRNVVPGEGPFGAGVASEKHDYAPDLFFDEAERFVRAHVDEPFFLYLATTVPHANNEAGMDGMEVPELGTYADAPWPEAARRQAAMITRLDRRVGALVALIDELGLGDDTLVLFTSDNGPHAEGGLEPGFHDSNGPLRGIKRSLHEGGIRVPLVARWTGHVAPGTESDHVATFADFLATAGALAGAQVPEGLDGIDFSPTLLGRPDAQREHELIYFEFHERGTAQAARKGPWKAIRTPMLTGPLQLYDLDADLAEQHDLAAERPELAAELGAALDAARAPSPLWKLPGE